MKKADSDQNNKKVPWPTKDAMAQVYAQKLWGGHDYDFYSGSGSHQPDIVKPYIAALTSFFNSFKLPLVVCDLGCGDFNVGKELLSYTKQYTAVDIVPELITRNKEQFKAEHLEFYCLDMAEDELPAADCALVRQVLQHLSNEEIQKILEKLSAYKYLVLTEHIPKVDFVANKDIISGQGTRLKKQSGVDILAKPFQFKVKEAKQLVSIDLMDGKGKIVTTVYQPH